jgi:hypothetical protein
VVRTWRRSLLGTITFLSTLPCDEDSIDPDAETDVVRESMKGEPSQMENAIAT